MGWKAITKRYELLEEGIIGRPVQAGEEGQLFCIMQEDYGHKIAVDLINGIIAIDYADIRVQNQTIEIDSPSFIFYVCEETNIVGEFMHMSSSEPDNEGNIVNTFIPLTWRPIWFTRMTMGIPTKVIGVQTTLPIEMGGKNIKKLISLFSDGRVGID